MAALRHLVEHSAPTNKVYGQIDGHVGELWLQGGPVDSIPSIKVSVKRAVPLVVLLVCCSCCWCCLWCCSWCCSW